ncbi:MAG: ABC transporter ATP-binding protein [Halolamina sp.]
MTVTDDPQSGRAEEPLLEVENLRTTFPTDRGDVAAVDGISFSVDSGEVFGIVGESGSGKSVTALSILQLADDGVVEADAIRYRGRDISASSDDAMRTVRGGEISMIFQDPMSSLNPVMTIGEQIAEVVRHHGDLNERRGFVSELRRKYLTGTDESSPSWERAVELLDTVGIPDPVERANEYPHQLSGGMKQRVMIAQALAGDPSLIIADEPTTALDVTIEAQILNELLELRDEFDVSIVLITHDLAVVRETCDRVTVMYAGEVMETARTETLFENPVHPYTRGLLESIPRVGDDREWLDTIEGSVPDPLDRPTGCPFQDRCDATFDLCTEPLVSYDGPGKNHEVRCHLQNDAVDDTSDGVTVDSGARAALRARTTSNGGGGKRTADDGHGLDASAAEDGGESR